MTEMRLNGLARAPVKIKVALTQRMKIFDVSRLKRKRN